MRRALNQLLVDRKFAYLFQLNSLQLFDVWKLNFLCATRSVWRTFAIVCVSHLQQMAWTGMPRTFATLSPKRMWAKGSCVRVCMPMSVPTDCPVPDNQSQRKLLKWLNECVSATSTNWTKSRRNWQWQCAVDWLCSAWLQFIILPCSLLAPWPSFCSRSVHFCTYNFCVCDTICL